MATRSRPLAFLLPALLLAACGAAAPSASIVPTAAPAAGVPTPDLTPVPGGQAPVSGPPGLGLDATEGEAMLLAGIRMDLLGTCGPVRDDLPVAAVASVGCAPASDQAVAVRLDLFDEQATLLDAYAGLIGAAGVAPESNGGSCFEGEPAEGAWVPGENPAAIAERGACWFDADGAPVYLATQPPYVLITVTGAPGSQLASAHQYAWLGNEDAPGAPTVWREIPVDAEK